MITTGPGRRPISVEVGALSNFAPCPPRRYRAAGAGAAKEYDFARLKNAEPKYLRRMKAAVTMRLDADVIAYFRALATNIGMPYQSLINYVLGEYASRKLQPSANWGAARRRATRAAAG